MPLIELSTSQKTAYRTQNRTCEVLPYFATSKGFYANSRHIRSALIQYASEQTVNVPYPQIATELHHVIGSNGGATRMDVTTNLIHVCYDAHHWLETHKKPGIVLCLWIKQCKGELDWDALDAIAGKNMRGYLDTDSVIEQCQRFPWIDEKRKELKEHADV